MRKEKLDELKSYIEELKTIKKEIVRKESDFLKIKYYNCHLNNGKSIIREKLIKGNSDGSASIVLPVMEDNDVILVVEPRVFTKDTVSVGLPAGYIEKDEMPIEGALRELKEEIGCIPKNIKRLVSYYQDEGCSSAYNHSFIAFECIQKFKQNLDNDEYIKYFKCHFEEALELIEMNYINGANSIITLEKAKTYFKRR